MNKKKFCYYVCILIFVISACKSTNDIQGGISKSTAENIVTLQSGKALKGLEVVGEDDMYYCNLEENVTGVYSHAPEDYPVLVCKDPVYDITYYVNYGRDYFIYAKRGDTSECVVQIPARDLYCREGVLYFRTDDYDLYEFVSFVDGAVLTYNPAEGKVEVLIDEPTFEMMVYPDGILYTVNEEYTAEDGTRWGIRHKYFYSYQSEERKEFPSPMRTVSRWKEYQLVAVFFDDENGEKKEGFRLETPQGEVSNLLAGWTEFPPSYRITEEGIHYIDINQDTLMHYDVETGELKTLVELAFSSDFPNGYLVFNEMVFFSNGIRHSLVDTKQYLVKIKEKENAQIMGFYTDGEEIYALADGMLWLYEEEKVDDSGFETTQIQGRSVIVGCYEAELHPLGE